MPSVSIRQTPDGLAAESVEEKLRRLEAVWKKETAYLSSSTAIVSHPAFQEIVGLGEAVVPLLLRDLEQ